MKTNNSFSEQTPPRLGRYFAKIFALFFCLAMGLNVWGETETIFSMSVNYVGGSAKQASSAADVNLSTGGDVTVTGGSAYVHVYVSSAKDYLLAGKNGNPQGLKYSTNDMAFVLNLDNALSVGDVITFDGVTQTLILTQESSPRPNSVAAEKRVSTTNGSYTVVENDVLVGATTIYTGRDGSSATFVTMSITHEGSSDPVTPTDPVVAFDNGTYYLGASALDLKTLKGSTFVGAIGSVSFAVTDAGTTGATIDGTNFTATAAGTATITATHAATSAYNEGSTTFTVAVTEAPKSDKCQLISAKYSNGFYGAIAEPVSPANGVVEVRYLQGTAAPTLTDVEVSENATYVDNGSTIVVTAEDGTTTATYDVNIAAVAPLDVTAGTDISADFTEVPAWIYNPYGYDGTKGLKFAKKQNDESNMRISKGWARQYYFISAAQKLTLTSATQSRNIKVYKDGVELPTPTATGAADNTIEIALNPAAACMITIESNQTGGDGGFKHYAIKANPSAGTHNITYTNLKGADNSANPTSFEEGAGVANFTALADVTGYTFAGWSPASIADDATEDQTIAATWTPVQYAITYEGLEGATHSNPATYTIEDEEIVFSAPSTRVGYTFTGWTPASIAAGSHEAKTVTANWAGAEPTADYKLISAGVLDKTNFRHVTETLTDENYVVNGISYTKCMALGATNSAMIQLYAQNKFVAYDSKTDATSVDIVVYNKNSSSKNLTILVVPEGAELSACVPETIAVASKTGVVKSVAMTGRSTLYCSVSSTDVRFCQIRVNETGSALPAVGENGYSVNHNLGRLAAESGKSAYLDGIEYVVGTNAKVMNSTEIKITTLGTHYVKFTLPAAAKLNVTTSNTSRYYVATAKDGTTNETTPTAGEATSFELAAGTWYINPAGSGVSITNISFASPTPRYDVTFESNGGSDVETQSVLKGGKVTEPEDPTKTDYDFVEWCADEELTTPFDFENTTISAATTIYAKWTAHVTSTDATLASLTVDGNDILNGDEVEYTVYADALPTVVATKNNEYAEVTPSEAVTVPGTSTYLVTAESGATKTYTLHIKPFAQACGTLAKVTVVGGHEAEKSGVLPFTSDINLSSNNKMDNGKYAGITLTGGTFKAGDVVNINISTQGQQIAMLFADKAMTNKLYEGTDAGGVGDNYITLPAEAEGLTTIYVARNDVDCKWNPYIAFIEVTRDCNPQITDFEVAGVHATIDHNAETITAELPYGTSLASLTPTVTLGNGGTSYTPAGAQDFTSPVAYTVTGANGSRTYTVTLTVEAHTPSMTLSSASGTIALTGATRTKNVKTTLTGEWLTDGTYDVAVSASVDGLTIAPANFTVAAGAVEQEFTITYASEADVTEANVDFTFSDGATNATYTLTYSSAAWSENPLLTITEAKTFDFVGAVTAQLNGVNDGTYMALSNYAGVAAKANPDYVSVDFNKLTTGNLQGKGLKFDLGVRCLMEVEFSCTGGKDDYRILYVNGVATEAKSKTTTHVKYSQIVEAGEVNLTAWDLQTNTWNMLNFYKVTFTTYENARNITSSNIGTICLEKEVVAFQGATFYEIAYKELVDGEPYKIFFDQVDHLEAGKAYIFEPEADATEINVIYGSNEAAAPVAAADNNGLQGTFVAIAAAETNVLTGNYLVSQNRIRKCGANCSLAANRAYIVMGDVPVEETAAPVAARRISLGTQATDMATDLESLSGEENATKIMVDGVLFILRHGQMYDSTGRLVK